MGGIPWILWRHVAWEVFRTFVVTTSIIVTVIAFGAAAKPLADNSIGADTVLKYVSLAMVPMLQYAMPFAAGFAATIVMHRFAGDNELVAMGASGLRHRTVLAPVLVLGVVLLVIMTWLVNAVVPRFWGLMRDTVAQDAAAVFVSAVERGEALDAGELTIYADAVEVEPGPPDTGAVQRLKLAGVAAVQRGRDGAGTAEFVSERAIVDVHRREGATVMKLSMSNGTGFRAGDGTVAFIPQAAPDAVEIGRATERDARSTTSAELAQARAHLDGESELQAPLARAAGILERVDLLQCVERTLATTGGVTLQDDVSRRRFRVESARASGDRLAAAGGAITMTEIDGSRMVRRASAGAGALLPASAGEGNRLDLVLEAPSAQDLAGATPTPTRWPTRLRDLRCLECPSTRLDAA
ncbi:MAG: LptF/LptG family permease, partial [Phycisphaerales bacterium]